MDNSRKKKIWSLEDGRSDILVIVGIVIVVIAFLFSYFTPSQRPSMLSSQGVGTVAEKVGTIARYVELRSPVEDIEYYCTFTRSYIGPSSYHCVVAVKVAPSDINKWLENYDKSTSDNNTNGQSLPNYLKRNKISLSDDTWRYSSKLELFHNGTDSIIVFREEGILFIEQSN